MSPWIVGGMVDMAIHLGIDSRVWSVIIGPMRKMVKIHRFWWRGKWVVTQRRRDRSR